MDQDELFPETRPPPPPWPGKPVLVSSGFVQHGGRCGHCDTFLHKDKAIHKLAPACCRIHMKFESTRSKNGPGTWVCEPCRRMLLGGRS